MRNQEEHLFLSVFVALMFSSFILTDDNEAEMTEKAADEEDSSSSHSGDDDDEGVITEIRFVPSDKAACELSHGG